MPKRFKLKEEITGNIGRTAARAAARGLTSEARVRPALYDFQS
jgi:hypothetical protein